MNDHARYALFEVAIDIIKNCELMEKGKTTPEWIREKCLSIYLSQIYHVEQQF